MRGRGVSLVAGGPGYKGKNIDAAEKAMVKLRDAAVKGTLHVTGPNTEEMELDKAEVYTGGQKWAPILKRNVDVIDGTSTHNESNIQARSYDQSGKDGIALLNKTEEVSVAFASGIKSGFPGARVYPPAIGGKHLTSSKGDQYAVDLLSRYARHIKVGLFDNVIILHVYTHSLAEKLSTILPALAKSCGFPTGTRFKVTEFGISLDDFTTEAKAAESASRMATTLFNQAKIIPIETLCAFTPWKEAGYHRLFRPESLVGKAYTQIYGRY